MKTSKTNKEYCNSDIPNSNSELQCFSNTTAVEYVQCFPQDFVRLVAAGDIDDVITQSLHSNKC